MIPPNGCLNADSFMLIDCGTADVYRNDAYHVATVARKTHIAHFVSDYHVM